MIIFHEGLPGSGKSLGAMVDHVLPAIKNGRDVYAFIEGLDFKRIAEVLKIDESLVRSLLHQLTPDDVPNIYKLPDNALIVIDELQGFWGKGDKPSSEIRKFVAEHRHRGFDILAMGQDVRDCNELWKRRVDQKVLFTCLDMAGQKSRYRWMLYKATAPEKYMHVSSGVGKYDPKYFGIYKSHVSDSTNVEKYVDPRANIFRTWKFYGAVIVVVLALTWAPYKLYQIFDPSSSSLITHHSSPVVAKPSAPSPVIPAVYHSVSSNSAPAASPKLKDYVAAHVEAGYRVRLVSVLTGLGRPPYVVVEFRDSSYRVQDRLTSDDLKDLGWGVDIASLRLVRLHKAGFEDMIATAWPLETFGAVSDQQNEEIRSRSDGAGGRSGRYERPQEQNVTPHVTPSPAPVMASNPRPIPTTPDGRIAWSAGRVGAGR